MLDAFMQQLAREMEILNGAFPQDDEGYLIPLDPDVKIRLKALAEGFTIHCDVLAVPETNKETFIARAMLGNLFGQGTRGAILGLSEDGKFLVLNKTIDYAIDYKEFRDLVEDFINTVDFWRAESAVVKK